MFSFRRSAFLLVFSASAVFGLPAARLQAQAGASQPAAAPQTQGPLTVQARLKARREQRRAAAIHDVYSHLYEAYVGTGWLRFTPGASLQKVTEYAWNVGVTRYFNERLGVTVDGRGYYGTSFLGLPVITSGADNRPAISQYSAMGGPTYRFVLHPKYSVSGRILGGVGFGNFSGDLGSFTPKEVGLYSNGPGVAISAGIPLEYNLSPQVGVRIIPEDFVTSYGSTVQNNVGFTAGMVVRWGKQ